MPGMRLQAVTRDCSQFRVGRQAARELQRHAAEQPRIIQHHDAFKEWPRVVVRGGFARDFRPGGSVTRLTKSDSMR